MQYEVSLAINWAAIENKYDEPKTCPIHLGLPLRQGQKLEQENGHGIIPGRILQRSQATTGERYLCLFTTILEDFFGFVVHFPTQFRGYPFVSFVATILSLQFRHQVVTLFPHLFFFSFPYCRLGHAWLHLKQFLRFSASSFSVASVSEFKGQKLDLNCG